jgi:hypothetical protein
MPALPFPVETLFPVKRPICDGFRVRDPSVGPMLRERGEGMQILHLDTELFEDALDPLEPSCIVAGLKAHFAGLMRPPRGGLTLTAFGH